MLLVALAGTLRFFTSDESPLSPMVRPGRSGICPYSPGDYGLEAPHSVSARNSFHAALKIPS